MKKFLLLPLVTMILSSCSSESPAPVVEAGELPPGVMEPVMGTGATSYGWQSEVQNVEMPSSMVQSIPQPAPLPQSVTPQSAIPQPAVVSKTVEQGKQAVSSAQKFTQEFSIPRDENNSPIYSQIDKGFYGGETYTVRKGDTMFLIAYICGKDVNELATLNNLKEPYQLKIGQVLKTGNVAKPNPQKVSTQSVASQHSTPVSAVTYTQGANGTAYGSDGSVIGPIKAKAGTVLSASTSAVAPSTSPEMVKSVPIEESPSNVATPAIKWSWPTKGKVIAGFSSSEGGNKGIDIAGSKGQSVNAAANGRVVYAGTAIRGYGNLIIIKHNDDYLSAYAHNDTILVKEQAQVSAGQKIATMGNSDSDNVKLHFEIRYKGKSVDPMRYLSK